MGVIEAVACPVLAPQATPRSHYPQPMGDRIQLGLYLPVGVANLPLCGTSELYHPRMNEKKGRTFKKAHSENSWALVSPVTSRNVRRKRLR
ncbi:hypothetical protein JZ751_002454 [Albula glossodonta]|uniref:Uncharacterized protein n=1 Tax=Albula glossodonta TaxID=121402 RepID=A0A8T2NI70_9TELE|nr:hypothetical protein JZ751_002454 [Albula glossodonta]